MDDGQIGTSQTPGEGGVSAGNPALRTGPILLDARNQRSSNLLKTHRHQFHLPGDGPLWQHRIRRQIWQDYCWITEG